MNWNDFSKHLQAQLQEHLHPSLKSSYLPIKILSAQALGGGDSHSAYRLQTATHTYFLKLNQREKLPLFETEMRSLNAIKQNGAIRCPQPIATGIYFDQAWLLMEHLTLTSVKTADQEQRRGRALAQMHRSSPPDQHAQPTTRLAKKSSTESTGSTTPSSTQPFGWFENNFIGLTPQNNQWHGDWVEFYAQMRLRPQLELASLRNAPASLYALGLELMDALPFWFVDYTPEPSLLHGDLWGGNSAFNSDGQPVVFDPACYYGDRETDLAMSELFGGFSADFYAGYHEAFPLDSGYKRRLPLYNLYHILNHNNLFGGDYARISEKMMTALLRTVR